MDPGFRRDDDNSQPTMSSRRKPGPMARWSVLRIIWWRCRKR